MSSKFNNAPVLQKTPKICKVPPEKLPNELKQFANWTLQAYAKWVDPFSPLDGFIEGQTLLHPYPLAQDHKGIILGNPHSLNLILIYDPDTQIFIYTIELRMSGVLLETAETTWPDAKPLIPFKTDLFKFEDPTKTRTVQSKIFS